MFSPGQNYPIGFVHIDIAEVRTVQGKLFPFIAIDRTPKLPFARLAGKAIQAMQQASRIENAFARS